MTITVTTQVVNHSRPRALLFCPVPGSSLPQALADLGFDVVLQSEAVDFLKTLNQTSPTISFIQAAPDQFKVVRALVLSVRKIMGQVVPLYLLVNAPPEDFLAQLKPLGASGNLEEPVALEKLAKLLERHVATDEIAAVLSGEAPTPAAQPAAPTATTLNAPVIPASAAVPQAVGWIFEKVFPVMATLSSSLESLDEIESRINFYAQRMVPFQTKFVAFVNAQRKSKDDLPFDLPRCVRFYGITNAKALVVADRLLEALRGSGLKWNDKTGRPEEEPAKILATSLKLLAHFGEESIYREAAFNSGLIFDLLFFLAEASGPRKAALKKEIEAALSRAIARADKAIVKAKTMPQLPLAAHVVTTQLMLEAGKMVLALLHPEYPDFLKAVEKAKLKAALQQLSEQKKLGASHNLIGALICQVTPGLSKAYPAVLFSHYSFAFTGKAADQKTYGTLAELCDGV